MKAKVIVPQDIYRSLESIKNHKAVRMSDRHAVIQHARRLGLAKVAKWIEINSNDYLIGTVNGFEPIE